MLRSIIKSYWGVGEYVKICLRVTTRERANDFLRVINPVPNIYACYVILQQKLPRAQFYFVTVFNHNVEVLYSLSISHLTHLLFSLIRSLTHSHYTHYTLPHSLSLHSPLLTSLTHSLTHSLVHRQTIVEFIT